MKTDSECFEKLLEEGRVITISEDGKIALLLVYSITSEPHKFLNNLDNEYIEHDPFGNTAVIQHMVCGKFKKEYARIIEKTLCDKYENLEYGIWRRHRIPEDKIFKLKRSYYEV